MMRTMRTITWLAGRLSIVLLYLATSAWAQDSGGSPPQPSPDAPQVAQPSDGSVNWKGVGVGAGAVAGNLIYVPAKLVYGILGGIAGGAGYALTGGNKQVADTIWRSSLGGDYVLTPDMMTGEKPIYFSGPSETGPTPAAATGTSSLRSNSTPSTSGASLSTIREGADPQPATHPIDNGAGLVRTPGVSATGGSQPAPYAGANNHGSYNRPSALKGPALPDTSIE
jgi:hypothetical protein